MRPSEKTITRIGFAAIGFLLIGLAGWYFFISRQTTDIESADLARGFNVGIPSFSGSRGSTAENIAAGFGLTIEEPVPVAEGDTPSLPRLWRVNTTPVAGMGFVTHGSSTLVRYVERSTGHVFDANVETGEVIRRTNRLIPKIYEAFVGNNNRIIARSVENNVRSTFVGSLGTTTVEGYVSLLGTDLGPDITDIAFTDTGVVFLADRNGSQSLMSTRADGSEPKQLTNLAAGNFNLISIPGKLVLVERPASGVVGNAFEVVGNTLLPLARNVPGLTVLPRASSTALLIGSDTGTRLVLSARPAQESNIITFGLQTTAEKCVWGNVYAYCAVPQTSPPDFLTNWYRGRVHTADSWVFLDVNAGTSTSLYETNPDDAIDVERPYVDDSENYLTFMNARDKSLWVLRIKE